MSQVAGVRDALLIATGEYQSQRLKRLRSPIQDAKQLGTVLGDPSIGGFEVSSIIDKPHYETTQKIEQFFQNRRPGDLLLVQISCHGIKDGDGLLHFAATNTNPDLPASTAISAEFIKNQIYRSRAKSVVLLLDCCYSGSFLTGMKADENVDIREELAGHGRVVITATNRTEYAWEGDRLLEFEPEPSRFTGAIIEGLRTGDADLNGDGKIAIDELYEYVYARLRNAKARQTPQKWADLEYQVFVAMSRKAKSGAPRQTTERVDENALPKSRWRRGRSATIRMELTLQEIAVGAIRELVVDTAARCPSCGATGSALRDMPAICDKCQGNGTVSPNKPDTLCTGCQGYGTIIPDPCPECTGEGRIRTRRTLKVRVPAGVEHGTHIQLPGEGEVGPLGGAPRDIFLEVVQLEHPDFKRVGDDLFCSATISRSTINNGIVKVHTIHGIKTVRIPDNFASGQKLRIRGAGVPHLYRDLEKGENSQGDLFVEIKFTD